MTTEHPRVSIIVPCYNGENLLEETVQSVLSQTFPDWELILINDGSTDGTGRLIDAIRRRDEARIRVAHTANQGISRTRNHGTGLARGDYFQFLDHDDLLPRDSLEHKVAVMEQYTADVVYGDYQRLVPRGNGKFAVGGLVRQDPEDFDQDLQTAIVQSFWIPPAGLLYRRTLVEAIGGFDPAYPIVQDHIFMFEAARRTDRWAKADGIVALYREYPASNSKKDASAFYGDLLASARAIDLLWQSEQGLNETRRKALLKRYFRAATYFYERDRAKFDRIWEFIRFHDPKFVPPSTLPLRLASRLLGYPRAEAVAATVRKVVRLPNLNRESSEQ